MRQRQEFKREPRRGESGFSIIETIIVLLIITIAGSFAVMGYARARASMRVDNSARIFAGHLERARTDAIRRHDTARVQILTNNATSFVVTMDFDGNGTVDPPRVVNLEDGVRINSIPRDVLYNWRGRVAGGGFSLSFVRADGGYSVQLDVTGSGDITIGEDRFLDDDIP
jgi:type II secretory pathway pseudopilin PulG